MHIPSVLLRAAEQVAGRAVNVHSAGDLSLLPSRVQNAFPQLR